MNDLIAAIKAHLLAAGFAVRTLGVGRFSAAGTSEQRIVDLVLSGGALNEFLTDTSGSAITMDLSIDLHVGGKVVDDDVVADVEAIVKAMHAFNWNGYRTFVDSFSASATDAGNIVYTINCRIPKVVI